MRIYQLTEEYQERLEQIGNLLMDGKTPTQDEVLSVLSLQDDIEQKVVNYAKYIKGLESESDVLDAEIKRLQSKKKVLDSKASFLKDTVKQAMELIGINKIDDPVMPVRVQQNSVWSVIVKDPKALPDKYQSIKVEADKKALLKDKDAINFEGVEFVKGTHLRVG